VAIVSEHDFGPGAVAKERAAQRVFCGDHFVPELFILGKALYKTENERAVVFRGRAQREAVDARGDSGHVEILVRGGKWSMDGADKRSSPQEGEHDSIESVAEWPVVLAGKGGQSLAQQALTPRSIYRNFVVIVINL
jgi:hypothetical protein